MVERLKICHETSLKKTSGLRDQKRLIKISTQLQHAIAASEQAVTKCTYILPRKMDWCYV